MNPPPMQFTMGAKMYQNGVGSVDRPRLRPAPQMPQGLPGVRSSQEVLFEKFAQGYMPQTPSEIQMHRKYKSGDFVTPVEPSEKEKVMESRLSEEQLSRIEMLKNKIRQMEGNPFRR